MRKTVAILITLTAIVQPLLCYPSNEETRCPAGWRENAGQCYYMSTTEANHSTARSRCHASNAELTSINSDQELQFIRAKTKGRRDAAQWIGLYKRGSSVDSSTYWLDGSTSPYRNDYVANENSPCVMLNDRGSFRDRDCGRKFRYVCKMAALTAMSTDVTENNMVQGTSVDVHTTEASSSDDMFNRATATTERAAHWQPTLLVGAVVGLTVGAAVCVAVIVVVVAALCRRSRARKRGDGSELVDRQSSSDSTETSVNTNANSHRENNNIITSSSNSEVNAARNSYEKLHRDSSSTAAPPSYQNAVALSGNCYAMLAAVVQPQHAAAAATAPSHYLNAEELRGTAAERRDDQRPDAQCYLGVGTSLTKANSSSYLTLYDEQDAG